MKGWGVREGEKKICTKARQEHLKVPERTEKGHLRKIGEGGERKDILGSITISSRCPNALTSPAPRVKGNRRAST